MFRNRHAVPGVALSGALDTEFEQLKQSCAELASQMQCPHHFKDAKVEISGGTLDHFSMEVITCCEEFRRHVEEAVDDLVDAPERCDKGKMKQRYRSGRSAFGRVRVLDLGNGGSGHESAI